MRITPLVLPYTDGRLIPFDTYNLFYRDGLEESRLGPLRRGIEAGAIQ